MRYLCAAMWALSLAGVVAAAGCARFGGAGERELTFEATGEAVLEQPGTAAPPEDWGASVQATGKGFPTRDAATPTEKRLTALEAAKYRALAELVAKIEGTEVKRESRVLNLQFASEAVEASVVGQVGGATVVEQKWDQVEGTAEVTLRVYLDEEGNPVPGVALPKAPQSETARRARAEQAARVQALARLRRRVGRVAVRQDVRVENMLLSRQRARSVVDGMVEGVRFERPRWPTDRHCVVEARLTVPESELEELRELIGRESE